MGIGVLGCAGPAIGEALARGVIAAMAELAPGLLEPSSELCLDGARAQTAFVQSILQQASEPRKGKAKEEIK